MVVEECIYLANFRYNFFRIWFYALDYISHYLFCFLNVCGFYNIGEDISCFFSFLVLSITVIFLIFSYFPSIPSFPPNFFLFLLVSPHFSLFLKISPQFTLFVFSPFFLSPHTNPHYFFAYQHFFASFFRSGCTVKSLEFNGKMIDLERSGVQRKVFNINDFHECSKVVAKELLKGSLNKAVVGLKELLGEYVCVCACACVCGVCMCVCVCVSM